MMESQSCDAEPPPPPKPELPYPGITRGNAEGKSLTSITMKASYLKNSTPVWSSVRFTVTYLIFFPTLCAECSLLNKAPPTPTMYKYRPTYSPGKNHMVLTHAYANQVKHTNTME